jgi:hypothetical protein
MQAVVDIVAIFKILRLEIRIRPRLSGNAE